MTAHRTGSLSASPRQWALLLVLVVLWGSSYLLIELSLRAFSPAQITGLRITAAALVLLLVLFASDQRLPRSPRDWALCIAMAVLGNILPFLLISWGQQEVESALAGILAATTPLGVLVLAHFVLADEKFERRHGVAFALAFAGVAVLLGVDALAGLGGSFARVTAQLAIVLAAAGYAAATVMARFMPANAPLSTATAVMLSGAVLMSPWTLGGLPALAAAPMLPILAIAILGVLGTGFASIIYFHLVGRSGARFTSMLNYLVPVWAAALGVLLLGESLGLSAWLALALILGGLLLTQRRSAGA